MGTTAAELKTDFEKIDQLKKEVEYLKGITLIAIEEFEKNLEAVELHTDKVEPLPVEYLDSIKIISPEISETLPPLKDSIKQIK